jgi:hypothetical protein
MVEQAAIDILQPVLESAVILAAHYCRACNRTTVTATDMNYALKYSARHVTGTKIGTMFPEDDTDSEDDDVIDTCDEEDEPFTRYQGDDKTFIEINECFDTWNQWDPYSPAEILLKKAIDSNGGVFGN